MPDRISGHAVNARGHIHLLDTICVAQRARGDLSGSGLFAREGGAEGERASGPYSRYAADHALLTHAEPDHRTGLMPGRQELHHYNVVVKLARRAYDLEEVTLQSRDLGQRLLQILRAPEV